MDRRSIEILWRSCLARMTRHLQAAVKANRKARLPAIDVSPLQGKFLHVLVRMTQAQRRARDRHPRRLLDHLDGPRLA